VVQPFRLRDIARRLRAGQIIAYPTEAVFGLGCDPRNRDAVERVLTIKRRSPEKGLILIAADFPQLAPFLKPLDAYSIAKLEATWPGPVTWLVPARDGVPAWLRGRYDTLAVRVTAHPVASALCRAWGGPLVSTSANISGRPPARSALSARRQLGSQVNFVVSAPVGHARRPTEIRDLQNGRVVRSG
jgi:L-threonylcarbamoyladenylate synthase